ncbi:hypothetical protein Tco_0016778 [Tanacetum coccineum]
MFHKLRSLLHIQYPSSMAHVSEFHPSSKFESFESSESFEYSFETQMLVQRLTKDTLVQMVDGKEKCGDGDELVESLGSF